MYIFWNREDTRRKGMGSMAFTMAIAAIWLRYGCFSILFYMSCTIFHTSCESLYSYTIEEENILFGLFSLNVPFSSIDPRRTVLFTGFFFFLSHTPLAM